MSGNRPEFIDHLSEAYGLRRKGVIAFTGRTNDLYQAPAAEGRFVTLEQTLYQVLSRDFLVVRLDGATGITFYDRADETKFGEACAAADVTADDRQKIGNVRNSIEAGRHNVLPNLVFLRNVMEGMNRARRPADSKVKPLCIIVQRAGFIFPAGETDRLSELDRQRLGYFLDWISDPLFSESPNLICLIGDTRAEMNSRLFECPATEQIEISLPSEEERRLYVTGFVSERERVAEAANRRVPTFEPNQDTCITDSAGLRLTSLRGLLEASAQSGKPITRKTIMKEVNKLLEAQLGSIIRVSRPGHAAKDVIAFDRAKAAIQNCFKRCENPYTAVPALLVSGPNGVGKTFLVEAFASEFGWVVVELTGLRGKYVGDTDKAFELFRSLIRVLGRVIVLVDEADTFFGNINSDQTHETEKRLTGNLIKMMGDRTFLGKVLWVLMTARPKNLAADIRRRCTVKIPIFDLEPEERPLFIGELFKRNDLTLEDADLAFVAERSQNWSADDYDKFVREILAFGRTARETLKYWEPPSADIERERYLQTLTATEFCSDRRLLPKKIAEMDPAARRKAVLEIQHELGLAA